MPQNIVFYYNDEAYYTLDSIEPQLRGVLQTNEVDKTRNFTIRWVWPLETGETEELITANNKEDTLDGKTIPSFNFDVVIKGKQIDTRVG